MIIDTKKLTYNIALWVLNILADLFFREIRARGSYRIPVDGPVIFVVGPHANQFVDPIMVMRECKRQVSFLIAEKSMHQKGIGFFARMLNAIPVIRPQDLAVKGIGTIQLLDRKLEPLRIIGEGTQFLKQLQPHSQIVLPNKAGQAEVVQILSDTELIIKKEFKDLKALALLSEGTPFKCIPHVDQDAVYRCVHDQLNKNQCITIFPEGGSHDRAELLPLKAGVTMMALGAMAKYPGLDVKIVPCGLNYFHAHRFRSRAVIEFGTPISIQSDLVEKYALGGTEKREACGKLLDIISDALKSVTVNAGNYETLMMIQAARRLYKPAHRKLHISQVVDLNRRFLIGYKLFKHEPQVEELHQRVLAYNQLLKYHGIRDHQVSKTDLGGKHTLVLLIKRCMILTLLTLCGFPGAVLNLPVIIVAKIISQKKADAALRGSSVKIAGRDVLATWKLLVGLVLIPTLYTFYGFLVFLSLLQTDLETKWKILIPLASTVFISIISYASIQFGEIGLDIARSLQPLVVTLMDPESVQVLRENRSKLSRDITNVINEYGPQAFHDFDADYISRTMPSNHSHSSASSPSPTPSKSTSNFNLSVMRNKLPRLRSGFFQHATKMEWLDDKNIFTWGGSNKTSKNNSQDSLEATGEDGYFWGRLMSRSGSESSTPFRSRSNSFTMVSDPSGLSMTTLNTTTTTTSTTTAVESPEHLFNRPTFKIQDMDAIINEDEGYADDQGLEIKKKTT
ncbi:uncharacterized protein BX664DRAFT_277983 [Halteromyces radiatus]|uniref:uncharacterized protein n=1 Tax=Halteromyces radiatus TaxID=101107 RepID=UPI00221FBD63|nr:uncharacterized protein BX664DRAFT_277983 [Halteromyces radiatus]KAI8093181.1 hypothetical protein BX664DRAFT_277983 [Halteromyces radiatus]